MMSATKFAPLNVLFSGV